MSYDVTVGRHRSDYTSNMRGFFEEYVGSIRELHSLTGAEMADRIDAGLARIVATSKRDLISYDADNGWGEWESATAWLMGLRDAGREHPTDFVEVSA